MKRIVSLLIVTIATGCVTFKEFQQLQTRVDTSTARRPHCRRTASTTSTAWSGCTRTCRTRQTRCARAGQPGGRPRRAQGRRGARQGRQRGAVLQPVEARRGRRADQEGPGRQVRSRRGRAPKGLPEDANSLYKAGKDALAKNDTLAARGSCTKFLDTFPDDPRAPEVQYLAGDTYFKEGKFGQAIKEYQRVYDRYKDVEGRPRVEVADADRRVAPEGERLQEAGGVLKFVTETDRKSPEAERRATC